MAGLGESWFCVAPGLDRAEVAAWASAEVGAAIRLRRQWFDTFDWALWRNGLALEVDTLGSGSAQVTLRGRDDQRVEWHQTFDDAGQLPRRTAELPPGPWLRTFGGLLGARALIPVASCELEQSELTVIDANRKIVARALWAATTVSDPAKPSQRSIRVIPVRGYERDARRLADRLRAHGRLDPGAGHLLEGEIVDGRTPGRTGTELAVRVEADLDADEAVRRMLRHLYGSLRVVEPWLSDPPDTVFLHDYRIALRRSRSVLRMARGVLPQARRDEWRSELANLQRRTGAARDLDVFIVEFPSYREAVPPEFANDIDPLLDLLLEKRQVEQRQLQRYLESDAHGQLKERYAEFLVDATPPQRGDNEATAQPIGVVAADRIRRAHRRVIRRGRRVQPDSPAQRLHDVRIAAKELRYAIELNAALLAQPEQSKLIARLKRLQNLLGDFQDAETHAQAMEQFAEELSKSGRVPARSIMSIGLLAQHFIEQKAELRTHFANRFDDFDTTATKKLLAALTDQMSPE